MEFFYDGQIRRYVTQFMRIFIGFKYQAGDGTQVAVPVMYGDMTRQVASIIRENSENKLPSVPRVACYITGLELDKTRLADATFVSKMNIHERDYTVNAQGQRDYNTGGGQGYTVERLMPTPFKLTMKADIWTSNTDQKLQLLEQITVLFNPSLEIQTTDNYIDWTSLSVIDLENVNFTSRSIPQGVDSDIDICTLEFKMPIYITPPAKVKRMGVVRDIIMNVFDANGDVGTLNSLVYNGTSMFDLHNTPGGYGVLLLSANLPDTTKYNVSVLNPSEAVMALGLEAPIKLGSKLDWNLVLSQYSGKHIDGITLIHFKQPNGSEVTGTVTINEIDPTLLEVTIDKDTKPQSNAAYNVNAIINPLTFNPRPNIAVLPATGTRYLLIDDIGGGVNNTFISDTRTTIIDTGVSYALVKNSPDSTLNFEVYITRNNVTTLVTGSPVPSTNPDSTFRILLANPIEAGDKVNYRVYVNDDSADAWAGWDLTDPFNPVKIPKTELIAHANDIVEFKADGRWHVMFDSNNPPSPPIYMTNQKTGVQYKWDGVQWLRSFEGEYRSGMWRFTLP